MAEEVGFEPTVPYGTTVFKTAALVHSATPPHLSQIKEPRQKGRSPPAQTSLVRFLRDDFRYNRKSHSATPPLTIDQL